MKQEQHNHTVAVIDTIYICLEDMRDLEHDHHAPAQMLQCSREHSSFLCERSL